MRLRSRVDNNQKEIVGAFRKLGCSVQHLHRVGEGVPDLLVGFRGGNYLVEVKSTKGKITDEQLRWFANWSTKVYIIRTIDDAVDLVRLWTKLQLEI